MPHALSYPMGGSYSSVVVLNPALVVVQELQEVRPVQRVLTTPSGKQWAFQLSGNRLQMFRMMIELLHEADSGGMSGLTTLRNFIENVVNYGMQPFDFIHDDSEITPVRIVPDSVRFEETMKAWWTGELLMQKYF